MSTTITAPPRPVMGEDARTRYTAALRARAGRQHGPLRVATVGEAKAAAALAHRYALACPRFDGGRVRVGGRAVDRRSR